MTRRIRVTVDEDHCIGSGQCQLYCPVVFEVVEGTSTVKVPDPPEDLHEAVRDAADACPSQAIYVMEDV